MERIFYRGDSMKRVFRPGDEVLVEPVAAAECRPGDIIVFTGAAGGQVIHRVIAATAEGLQTMGDNNDRPDDGLRRAGDELRLARARLRRGRQVPLARGAAGMREFRRHRFRRACRRIGGKVLRILLYPLGSRRLRLLDATSAHRFGEVVHREWRGRLVARCYPDGKIRYTHWYWRLLFAAPEGERPR